MSYSDGERSTYSKTDGSKVNETVEPARRDTGNRAACHGGAGLPLRLAHSQPPVWRVATLATMRSVAENHHDLLPADRSSIADRSRAACTRDDYASSYRVA
jgi:hypothetical protein